MRKLFLIIISFTCFMASSYAGQIPSDSNQVKKLLTQAEKHSISSDTFQILMAEALGTAEKIKYTKGMVDAETGLADYYFQTGNLSQSLQHLLNLEEHAIAAGDSVMLFNLLRLEYTIYFKIGDINMFRKTLMRRQYILDHQGIKGLTDTSYQVLSQYNSLAQLYAAPQINKPDSVEYFYRKIKNLGLGTRQANLWLQLSSGGIGKVLLGKNKFDSAIAYLRVALDASLVAKGFDNYYAFMISLSDAFNKAGQHDSSYHYAYKAFNGAAHNSLLSLLATSSGQLAAFYRNDKKYDSAVKYMTLETKYKDSVTGTKALNSIQFITKDYQLKSLEKQKEKEAAIREYKASLKNYFFIGGVLLLLVIIAVMYRINQQRTKSKQQIETAYKDLKATQAQLIQSEKMASLGELTAGIAHEIQNPLNFVNNFSEVNRELIAEMKEELTKGNIEDANLLANDIEENEQKINHHGKLAEDIVKGMLQHSRTSKGVKELTDINALADEYLRLSYHGLRAKDKSFNATMKTDFDDGIGKINIIPQDIGRVLLNLFNNAFYACAERSRSAVNEQKNKNSNQYEPTISVTTKKSENHVTIAVSDNGNGIPQKIVDKIFQPFFTTKPAGQGTGLGLSLSYDIIKAHGGEIKVESKEGEGTEFKITLTIS